MDFIDETSKRYATIDPLDFDNMSNHLKPSDDEDKILELDRIPITLSLSNMCY